MPHHPDTRPPSRRRQHAVPKFYLDRFSDGSGYVSAYNKISNRRIKRISTTNLTVESHFYTLRNVEADEVYAIEEALAKLEEVVSEIMRTLVRNRTVAFGDHSERRATKVHLSFFIAYLIVRSRKFREYNVARGNEYYQGDGVDKLFEAGPPPWVTDADAYYEALIPFLGGMRKIDDDRDLLLDLLFGVGNELAPHIAQQFRWIVVHNPNRSNITCDMPVGCLSVDDVGGDLWKLGINNIGNIWLPIDPEYALLLTKAPTDQTEYLLGRAEPLERWNQILRQQANRWVIWKGGTPADQIDLPRP